MIYITGDMHGDESRFFAKEMHRLKEGDTLIICGDFGFIWENSQKEKRFLEYLGSRKFNICFIDGTHENFDLLKKYRETVWKGGRVHRISRNLFHLERGQIFHIDGLRLFTFGGGESSDRDMRTEHKTWWKDELPSAEEMEEGATNLDDAGCEVDVIITHEPPSLVKSAMMLRGGRQCRVSRLNGYLEELNRNCQFQQWYFGYMHEDRVITPRHTSVFMDVLPVTCRSNVAGSWRSEDPQTLRQEMRELAGESEESASVDSLNSQTPASDMFMSAEPDPKGAEDQVRVEALESDAVTDFRSGEPQFTMESTAVSATNQEDLQESDERQNTVAVMADAADDAESSQGNAKQKSAENESSVTEQENRQKWDGRFSAFDTLFAEENGGESKQTKKQKGFSKRLKKRLK